MQPRQNRSRDNSVALGDSMPVIAREATGRRVGNARTEAGVWSTPIVVNDPLSQDTSKVPFIQHDQPIQAVSPDRADQPFAERVRLRASHRRLQHRDWLGFRRVDQSPKTTSDAAKDFRLRDHVEREQVARK